MVITRLSTIRSLDSPTATEFPLEAIPAAWDGAAGVGGRTGLAAESL